MNQPAPIRLTQIQIGSMNGQYENQLDLEKTLYLILIKWNNEALLQS